MAILDFARISNWGGYQILPCALYGNSMLFKVFMWCLALIRDGLGWFWPVVLPSVNENVQSTKL